MHAGVAAASRERLHHGDGRYLDREIHEVKRCRVSIHEHSEDPCHADATHPESHRQQACERQFTVAKAPDEKAAEANIQASVDGADLRQGAGYHRQAGLLGERSGPEETRHTGEKDEGSVESEDDTLKRHAPSLRDILDFRAGRVGWGFAPGIRERDCLRPSYWAVQADLRGNAVELARTH